MLVTDLVNQYLKLEDKMFILEYDNRKDENREFYTVPKVFSSFEAVLKEYKEPKYKLSVEKSGSYLPRLIFSKTFKSKEYSDAFKLFLDCKDLVEPFKEEYFKNKHYTDLSDYKQKVLDDYFKAERVLHDLENDTTVLRVVVAEKAI